MRAVCIWLAVMGGVCVAGEPVNLFGGNSLEGWQIVNAPAAQFVVREGELKVDGPVKGYLRSKDRHMNCVLEFETLRPADAKMPPGDSGVMIGCDALPMVGDYQPRGIRITRPGDPKAGEWEKWKVTVEHSQVTLEIDGRSYFQGYEQLDNGYLAIVSDVGPIRYRNLRLTPLITTRTATHPEAEGDRGLTCIFDCTWNGWKHAAHLKEVWVIEDGCIALREKPDHKRERGKVYDLSTLKDYGDFELQLDWKLSGPVIWKNLQILTPDGLDQHDAAGKLLLAPYRHWGDSGIYLRGTRRAQVNIWCEPCGSGEVATKYKDMTASFEDRRRTMPTIRADRGPNQWNRFIITMKGDRVSVNLNGLQVVQEARVTEVPVVGPITFQNHHDAVEFRNILIREIH